MGYSDGNGFVVCARGHRHWGRFGAAGVLVTDMTDVEGSARVLLQHRAAWTHEGGTWAVPGGARDSHEQPITAALREVAEETSLDPGSLDPYAEWIDDHGGWVYTTILARLADEPGSADVRSTNAESTELRWWPVDDVPGLPLHYGFATAWPSLRGLIAAGP